MAEMQSYKVTGRNEAVMLKNLLTKLKNWSLNLKSLNLQAEYLEKNVFVIHQMQKQIPEKYQHAWSNYVHENKNVPHCSEWSMLLAFLEETVEMVQYTQPSLFLEKSDWEEKKDVVCLFCRGKGHIKKDCNKWKNQSGPPVRSNAGQLKIKNQAKFDEMKNKYGACPVCKEYHTWVPKQGFNKGTHLPSDRLYDCPQFAKKPVSEQGQWIKDKDACALCMSHSHVVDNCTAKTVVVCDIPVNGVVCGRKHNKMLHGAPAMMNHQKRATINVYQQPEFVAHEPEVLLHMVSHVIQGVEVVIFMDDGSNASMITHKLAKRLGLKGEVMHQLMEVLGRPPEAITTSIYELNLKDIHGDITKLRLIGIERIATNCGPVDLSEIYKIFPHVKKGALDRPAGDIGILLGQDIVKLLPCGGDEPRDLQGNLRIMKTRLGSGMVLGGSHPSVKATPLCLTREAIKLYKGVKMSRFYRVTSYNCVGQVKLPTFLESEELGIAQPRRCERCKNCRGCSYQLMEKTRKEQEEEDLMRENFAYDESQKRCIASYPVIGDISKIRDNSYQGLAVMKSQERRLLKTGNKEAFDKQFADYVKRGVLVEVSVQEIQTRKNQGKPIHFISMHGVENPGSASTPLRLVTNSALKNCSTGPSINDMWTKGPNSLNSLYQVLIRFRCYREAIVWDLSKAYWSIGTTEEEKFTRLVTWKLSEEPEWKIYGFSCVAFGDLPASVLLELAKEKAADLGEDVDHDTALKVNRDSYVDDNLSGGTLAEVKLMKGELSRSENGGFIYNGTVSRILSKVGMTPKVIVTSGEECQEAIDKLGEKILGHIWKPREDLIVFRLVVNLYHKHRGIKTGPDITPGDVETLDKECLTKRKVLSLLASFYDPMGLLCAYLITLKIGMRELCSYEVTADTPENEKCKLDWDDQLPAGLEKKWKNLIKELVLAEEIIFARGTKPERAVGRPELIGLWDGSMEAYSALIYIRWRIDDDPPSAKHEGSGLVNQAGPCTKTTSWSASLLTAKARVSPLKGISAVRSELCGAVMVARLMSTVIKAIPEQPARVTILGDSEATIAALDSRTASLGQYFGNRTAEIWENVNSWGQMLENNQMTEMEEVEGITLVDKFYHIPGKINIADIATRTGVKLEDIGPDSEWQKGSGYVYTPRDGWPVSREFRGEVPQDEKRAKFYSQFAAAKIANLSKLDEIMNYSEDLTKVRGIVARYLRALCHTNQKRLKMSDQDIRKIMSEPDDEDYRKADHAMRIVAMVDTGKMLKKINHRKLGPEFHDGILWATGRLGGTMQQILGTPRLAILSPESRLAKLIMISSHRQDHRSTPGDALFRSRRHAWIIKGKALAKRVVQECAWCKVMARVPQKQKMGMLPPEKLEVPCTAFTHICLDMCGPYLVQDMVKKRTQMKVWPILFCCLSTGALHIELAPRQDTEAFLLTWEAFKAARGIPKTVYSDKGSNLTSAANYTQGVKDSFEFEEVQKLTAASGTKWKFAPSGAQWRDGLSESRVKMLKSTLKHLFSGGNLSFYEFLILLHRAANIINDRPLGVHHQNGEEGELVPITPNGLIKPGNVGNVTEDFTKYEDYKGKYVVRMKFLDVQFGLWWKRWFNQVFDSLLPIHHWLDRKKNLSPGDVVLVKYEAKYGKPSYRLAKILVTKKDSDGLVRTVRVGMRPRDAREPNLPYKSKNLFEVEMPIQRLCLIVPVEDVPLAENEEASALVNPLHSPTL